MGGVHGWTVPCQVLFSLPLLFLRLGASFPFITMLGFYVCFHGGHASRHKAVGTAGKAHLIMFVNMVIEGLIVRRSKWAYRAEVGVYSTAHQLHLRPAQGIARVEIP